VFSTLGSGMNWLSAVNAEMRGPISVSTRESGNRDL
jgi:hypothetical protein